MESYEYIMSIGFLKIHVRPNMALFRQHVPHSINPKGGNSLLCFYQTVKYM